MCIPFSEFHNILPAGNTQSTTLLFITNRP